MIFVAMKLDRTQYIIGANESSWGVLKDLANITRTARDHRLIFYKDPALAAFQALRRHEDAESRTLAETQPELGTDDRLGEARLRAVEAMRSDPTFLGGADEMGLALRVPGWSVNQACYACQGMMGYESPQTWSKNQRVKYIRKWS